MPSLDDARKGSSKPDQKQASSNQPSQERTLRRPQRDELKAVNERERQVQETYEELGNAGDKRGKQVTQDQLARGEVSRELREMRHGEIQSASPEPGKPKRRPRP